MIDYSQSCQVGVWKAYVSSLWLEDQSKKGEVRDLRAQRSTHMPQFILSCVEQTGKKKVDNKNSPRRLLKLKHFRETTKKSCQISCHCCKSELSELMVLSRGRLERGHISRLVFWWAPRKSLTIKAVFQADLEYSIQLFISHGPWLDEMMFSRCSVTVMQGFLLFSLESSLELTQWFKLNQR